MGLALAYKRGDVPDSKVSPKIKKLADAMSEKEWEKYASTKHKGLPKKVSEVDKSKKTVKASTAEAEKKPAAPKQETAAETPKQAPASNVRVIESIPRDKVNNFYI